MKRAYRTIRKQGKTNQQELTSFLVKNGQGLLPLVDLIEQCQVACDQLIDMTGRAAIRKRGVLAVFTERKSAVSETGCVHDPGKWTDNVGIT